MCVSCCLLQVYDKKANPNLDALQLDGAYPFERTKRGAIVWGFAKPGDKSVRSQVVSSSGRKGSPATSNVRHEKRWKAKAKVRPARVVGRMKVDDGRSALHLASALYFCCLCAFQVQPH